MKNKAEESLELFNGEYNCSQSVFTPYAEELGLSRELALKISCGFGAGISRKGSICGAVTGACMAIGLAYGKSKTGENENRDKTYSLIQKFFDQFEAKFGSVDCKALTGIDLNTSEGQEAFLRDNLFQHVCKKCVLFATEYVQQNLK